MTECPVVVDHGEEHASDCPALNPPVYMPEACNCQPHHDEEHGGEWD